MQHASSPLILVIMGVSGSGKSSVAAELVARLGWDFAEGDDMQPPRNVEKMRAGHPLTDADRAPWLARIADWINEHLRAVHPGIVTCSALKRRYRDELRAGRPAVQLILLTGDPELIAQRLSARRGHYMPASLLASQLAAQEPPAPEEHALIIDIGPPSGALAEEIIRRLDLSPRPESRFARPDTMGE